MNIQEAAKASGLPSDTIRFYERRGVLPRPPRGPNSYRAYAAEHVATLRLAKGLRQLGVRLEDVRPILEVAHSGACIDVRGQLVRTLQTVVEEIDRKLSELTETRIHAAQLLAGLEMMRPEDESVPGASACPCIEMVTAS